MRPRLVGVGVGPGDPELLTLKAARLIREADLIFAPTRRAGEPSMALSVVEGHVDRIRQRIVELPFPDDAAPEGWVDAARRIVEHLGNSGTGVFLTEGDPSLYGSFGHVAAALCDVAPVLTVETVPGVSSITAAAARAGISLADYHETLAVLPAGTGLDRLEAALAAFECVVVLKVGRRLPAVLALLERVHLLDQATYVRRCGWPDEQVVTDLRGAARALTLDYFSLLIVRRR